MCCLVLQFGDIRPRWSYSMYQSVDMVSDLLWWWSDRLRSWCCVVVVSQSHGFVWRGGSDICLLMFIFIYGCWKSKFCFCLYVDGVDHMGPCCVGNLICWIVVSEFTIVICSCVSIRSISVWWLLDVVSRRCVYCHGFFLLMSRVCFLSVHLYCECWLWKWLLSGHVWVLVWGVVIWKLWTVSDCVGEVCGCIMFNLCCIYMGMYSGDYTISVYVFSGR